MTKFVLCIIVGVVSLAACNTMMAVGENYHTNSNREVVKIVHKESKFSQCLDFNLPFFKGSNPERDVVPAELAPCSDERVNQFWIFTPEGFIESLDEKSCLIYDPDLKSKRFVNVKDCDKSSVEAKIWKVWEDGSIMHVYTHQALTATFGVPHPFVVLDKNTHAPSQVWEVNP